MSDLSDQACDQQTPPSSRISPENRPWRDRRLRVSDLKVALLVLLAACVRPPTPVTRPEVHRPEVWVDAFSPAGGDGSSARPLKVVPQPVPGGTTVHLRTGLYAGPFVLGEGARFEGHGEVVLTGEAGQTVVTAVHAQLEGVSVQGGAIGLEAGAGVVVRRAHFSGQRTKGVVVHGALAMSEASLEASVEGIEGVRVDRGASLELSDTRFTGGFRRAVMSEGGTLVLRQVTSEGPKTLLHAVDATSRLTQLSSKLGSGPALYFAGGSVRLQGAKLSGHEYSVMLFRGADAELSEVQAQGGFYACISAIESKLTLSRSTLSECGPGGAVSLENSRTSLAQVEISSGKELGLFVKLGTLSLTGLTVSRISADLDGNQGDALHVRGEAKVTAVGPTTVADVGGSALFASTYSEVDLPTLSVERAQNSALFVERFATVRIGALLVRGGRGAAVVVPDQATVNLQSLSVAGGNELPIYAECRAGARVSVGKLESTVQQLPSQCVTLTSSK